MKYAYMTALTNEDYLLGAKVLKRSLELTKTGNGGRYSVCRTDSDRCEQENNRGTASARN